MSLDDVIKKLDAVAISVASVSDRVGGIERYVETSKESIQEITEHVSDISQNVDTLKHQAHDDSSKSGPTISSSLLYNTTGDSDNNSAKDKQFSAGDSAAEIQRAFEQIQEGVAKVKLPNPLKVYHSNTGIKEDCKSAYNILKHCANYGETAAKWVSQQLDDVPEGNEKITIDLQDFHDLFTIIYAQNSYLRGEYTALLVKSSTQDEETTKFFRMLERNPTCFSEDTMKHLKMANQFAQLKAQSGSRGRGRNKQDSQRGGFGRGFGNPNFRPRDNYSHTYSGRGIPPRPNFRGGFGGRQGGAPEGNQNESNQ